MARIKDKVKIYIHQHADTGCREYHVHDLTSTCHWLTLVGTTEALIDFDEASLMDPHAAQLNKAEQDPEAHRAESAAKERQLLDKIDSLRALPHLGWIMTDRELLELAAKAARYERNSAGPIGPCEWNPLTDDGDALRLAVKLGITPHQYSTCVAAKRHRGDGIDCEESFGTDPYAATRRAIVRAAAAIGKEMP